MTYSLDQLPEQFRAKITISPSGCWLWADYRKKGGMRGYGYLGFAYEEGTSAHRVVYKRLAGTIPKGLCLDHLCRVRNCVNPAHLEPVTHAENVRRGMSGFPQSSRTHCPHGHEYNRENTRIKSNGSRDCKTCHNANARRRWTNMDPAVKEQLLKKQRAYNRRYKKRRRLKPTLPLAKAA